MKTILTLLVLIPLTAGAADQKAAQMEETIPDTGVQPERMNTSPNPVPDEGSDAFDGSLIKQKQEETQDFDKGPYDKDGNYTFPKKDTTEEIP